MQVFINNWQIFAASYMYYRKEIGKENDFLR
uniref:Uncharacterized protein n=1 Tax=Rhizophora mucronata TaxID=61149 RepID=A0A2P2J4Y0_RHIMU